MTRRFWAFTLAETLIVMGIIGVVAALTVPNLNASTGEKEKVAKVKKIYRDLNDAFGRAIAVYGPHSEWYANSTNYPNRFRDRLTDFMKVSKLCDNATCTGGKSGSLLASSYPGFITADGTYIGMFTTDNWIVVDIDGPNKGKNEDGKDVFAFSFSNNITFLPGNEIVPGGGSENNLESTISSCLSGSRYNCTTWVIRFENMDYLKIDSSKKCPNRTTVLDGTTNTTCK